MLPFDLHVLGMPPAFNLSQDQTLQLNFLRLATQSFELNVQPQAFIADSWFCYVTLNKFDFSAVPAGVRTSYLRTLSKISTASLSPHFVARASRPREPHIIQQFPFPSTPQLQLLSASPPRFRAPLQCAPRRREPHIISPHSLVSRRRQRLNVDACISALA